jgi:hypothetical protein
VGLVVFSIAWAMPERAGKGIAATAAGLVLAAPLLTGLLKALGFARAGAWWDIIQLDGLRILTGRGFDAANFAREKALVEGTLPFSFVSDIWFDLGILGALGVAMLVYFMFRAAGRYGLEVAPLALAGLSSAFTYAFLERSATQTWWLNGMAVFAIALASVERGRYRTVRPRAAMTAALP